MASGISIVQCPHHPYGTLIDDWRAGDQILSECGLVVGERFELDHFVVYMPNCFYAVSRVIDVVIEWQTFKNEAHDADTSAANTLLNEVNLQNISSK